MRFLRMAFVPLAIALMTSSARADLMFDFTENGLGKLGVTTMNFRSTQSSQYHIDITGTAGLYIKTSGGDESGLGLTNDPSGDHEITPMNSIDLNIAALKTLYKITKLTISIGSVQCGENYQVYGGSIAPLHVLGSGVSADGSVSVTGSNLAKYNDYIVTTTCGNILVASAAVAGIAVPEPSSLLLIGFGGTVGLIVYRRAQTSSGLTGECLRLREICSLRQTSPAAEPMGMVVG